MLGPACNAANVRKHKISRIEICTYIYIFNRPNKIHVYIFTYIYIYLYDVLYIFYKHMHTHNIQYIYILIHEFHVLKQNNISHIILIYAYTCFRKTLPNTLLTLLVVSVSIGTNLPTKTGGHFRHIPKWSRSLSPEGLLFNTWAAVAGGFGKKNGGFSPTKNHWGFPIKNVDILGCEMGGYPPFF